MSPMKNSLFFTPMLHVPLGKIDNFRYLKTIEEGWYSIVKPLGINVFLSKGKMFDAYGREIINNNLNKRFEKVKDICFRTNMVFIGTIYSNEFSLEPDIPFLYAEYPPFPIGGTKLLVYDLDTPAMPESKLVYKVRLDIISKVLADLAPAVQIPEASSIQTSLDLHKLAINSFVYPKIENIILYNPHGLYKQGAEQLGSDQHSKVSFSVGSVQKFRGHIKHIDPITLTINDEPFVVANTIQTKYRSMRLHVPILQDQLDFKRHLWTNRKNLKNKEFTFNGLIVTDDRKDKLINVHFNSIIV